MWLLVGSGSIGTVVAVAAEDHLDVVDGEIAAVANRDVQAGELDGRSRTRPHVVHKRW